MVETFQTQMLQPGLQGLDLKSASDLVSATKLLVMTNVVGTKEAVGEIQSRPGQQLLLTGGTNQHSIGLLDSSSGNTVVVVGADGNLYYGDVGVLTLVDSGYSGEPLWFVAYRPSQSALGWLYIGNSQRMRKISSQGLVLPIGLPPVSAAVAGVLDTEQTTIAELFNSAAGWGRYAYNGSAVPLGPASDPNPATGNGLSFLTDPGGATGAYANAWDHAVSVDMTQVGSVEASDSDYISFYLKLSNSNVINDVRLDFGIGGAGADGNFYTKHFRPSDFTQVSVAGEQSSIVGEDQAARYGQTDRALRYIDDDREIVELPRAQRQEANTKSLQTVTGDDTWTLFGTYGVVLRRGDFLRRGADETVGWADVQSITVTVFVSTNDAVEVSLSDLLMTGGSGPDTGEFGLSSYDYRVTNYDTRTGAESNPSPIQTVTTNALRRSIVVSPAAYGDSAIRQRIYRRGGTLNDNWYYVGENSADGAVFVDDASDAEAAQGGLLEIDNAQPVSTVNDSGTTILAQPLPAVWGPAQDFLFGCGDPYNAGSVYYCKQGQPDSWPPGNRVEVCSPAEPLQAGSVFGTQAFAFSNQRMFWLIPNAGTLGAVTSLPTQCQKGMYNRWGLAVGLKGIYFVSDDGIYQTSGGEAELLSEDIDPLFNNRIRNGYYPVDYTQPEMLRLALHDNELWFLYQDTQGNQQCMIFSLEYKYWRHYNFYRSIASACSDTTGPRLLLGSLSSGATYVHEGTSDDGQAISCAISLPYLDQGNKRQMKTYGDVTLDLSRSGVDVTIATTLDTGLTSLQPLVITTDAQADL